MHGPAARLRPHEAAIFQPLREQTQAVTIPPQQLDSITTAAPKSEQLTRERMLGELRLHDRGQPIEPVAQVRDPAREPDPDTVR